MGRRRSPDWDEERLKERNPITLAGYLKVALGRNLHSAAKEIFGDLQPQTLHQELARITIDLILSTSLDHLLGEAYITNRGKRPDFTV